MFPPWPYIADVPYSPAGGLNLTIARLYTTPRERQPAQPSYGVYRRWLTTFKILVVDWAEAIGANYIFPKMRDRLTIGGITWTVNSDVDSPRGPVPLWRLSCVHLEIDAALADTIDLVLPTDATDAAGSPLTTAGTHRTFSARIQFVSGSTEDFQGVQFQRSYYRVFVAGLNENLPLGTVIVATSGRYAGMTFRVLDNEFVDSLDELETLTCTIDP